MRRTHEKTLSVRVTDDVDQAITAHRARLEARTPGILLTRSDVLRSLLLGALAQQGARPHDPTA
jgi:hypothetical protein